MVTLIPVFFGAGKWAANLPTGYLLDRLGRRRLLIAGLIIIAGCDVASTSVFDYVTFLMVRGVAGGGWAMFATVATTSMIHRTERRGQAISLLLMAETVGLLVGSGVGGSLYVHGPQTSPFFFEALCMLIAAATVAGIGVPETPRAHIPSKAHSTTLRSLRRVPSFMMMCCTNAVLAAIQTGVMVFLFPLYLTGRAGMSPVTVGYLIALGVLGRLMALWAAGHLGDRGDRPRMLAGSLAVFGVLLAAFITLRSPWLLTVWSVLLGAAGGFVAGLPTAVVGDRVDPAQHGVAVAWLRTATDAGMVVGPLLMGQLADAIDIAVPFVVAGLISCVVASACYRQALTPTRTFSS
jgi:MFS family permease